jgi:hypothetical protein
MRHPSEQNLSCDREIAIFNTESILQQQCESEYYISTMEEGIRDNSDT